MNDQFSGSNREGKSLKSLLLILWEYKYFILRNTIIIVLISFAISQGMYRTSKPTLYYEVKTTMAVKVDKKHNDQKLAYLSLLDSRSAAVNVASKVGVNKDIANSINVYVDQSTGDIGLTLYYQNISQAIEFADELVNQSIIITNDILDGVMVSSRRLATATGNIISSKRVPNIKKDLLTAAVLGLAVMVFLTYFMEFLFDKIKFEETIEEDLGVELLAVMPNLSKRKRLGWWPWKP